MANQQQPLDLRPIFGVPGAAPGPAPADGGVPPEGPPVPAAPPQEDQHDGDGDFPPPGGPPLGGEAYGGQEGAQADGQGDQDLDGEEAPEQELLMVRPPCR